MNHSQIRCQNFNFNLNYVLFLLKELLYDFISLKICSTQVIWISFYDFSHSYLKKVGPKITFCVMLKKKMGLEYYEFVIIFILSWTFPLTMGIVPEQPNLPCQTSSSSMRPVDTNESVHVCGAHF